MKKYFYISLALMIFLLASAEKSLACSCVMTPGPLKRQVQDAYRGSNAIFSGEVTEIKESSTDKYNLVVKFKVAKSWKGTMRQEMTLTTGKDSAMCGYNFEVGKTYLVYAFGEKENFSTTICSRTSIFSRKGDAKYLDELRRKKKR